MEQLPTQRCFVNDEGYMICNIKHINGELRATKSGKCWRWYVGIPRRKRKSKEKTSTKVDVISKE